MASKFMKVRRMLISAITCVIIVSQLVGCAAVTSTEMMEILDEGYDVEIVLAAPSDADSAVIEQGKQQDYVWEQLDQLDDNNLEFRIKFDKLFNINRVTENGVNAALNSYFNLFNNNKDSEWRYQYQYKYQYQYQYKYKYRI